MAAAKYKLKIEQGTTWRKVFVWKAAGVPVDMTGWKARMQIREAVDADEILQELTSENGGIAIVPLLGQFTLQMTDAQTSALDFDVAVYDVELIDSGNEVTRIISGSVSLSRGVTR